MQKTANYGFNIYEPNDVTSYLTTGNQNTTLIDAAIAAVEAKANKNATDVATLEQQASSSHDEINELTEEVSDLQTKSAGYGSRIAAEEQKNTQQDLTIAEIQNDLAEKGAEFYSGVLSANEETLAITIGAYADNLIIMPTCSVYGLAPLTIEVRPATGGQPNLIVSTWTPQATDVEVTFVVWDRNPVAQTISYKEKYVATVKGGN